jgi:uncharacterized membrane protein YraQ (UPF0718 family)
MQFIREILIGCWSTLEMMAPFLLLGFLLSGILSVVLPVSWVKRHLAKSGSGSVVKSALLGVPLPLCSCGVLPVATWMRRHGASKGAIGSFLLATPQTGVDGFLVAMSLLGIGFALYIPLAAFVSGVLLGLILNQFPESERAVESEEETGGKKPSVLVRIFRHGFITIAGDIAIPLSVGILLAGVLSALVDPQQFAELGSHFWAKLVVVGFAAPLYVCATASIPIGASMLIAGLSPGTVFVFLMAGPATNAATFTTISKLIGRREAITYLACAILLAIGMGMLLDVVAPVLPEIRFDPHAHHDHMTGWHTAAAVVLIGVLGAGKYVRDKC